ncbi:hypothetical protein Tco_1482679 [Tanacetum coccineum]
MHTPTIPTSAVRNTRRRSGPQGLEEPTSDEVLRELCDKNYHQLLPIIAEKMQKEKEQQDKLNASPQFLCEGNRSATKEASSQGHIAPINNREPHSNSEDSEGGHWKSKSKRHMTRMPSHVKTYDRSGDPEDHLKLFQSAAKTERWAMPAWCHMFNSTLTENVRVCFDKLPKESIDSYEDLRAAFRENYLQQTKHIKTCWNTPHLAKTTRSRGAYVRRGPKRTV